MAESRFYQSHLFVDQAAYEHILRIYQATCFRPAGRGPDLNISEFNPENADQFMDWIRQETIPLTLQVSTNMDMTEYSVPRGILTIDGALCEIMTTTRTAQPTDQHMLQLIDQGVTLKSAYRRFAKVKWASQGRHSYGLLKEILSHHKLDEIEKVPEDVIDLFVLENFIKAAK